HLARARLPSLGPGPAAMPGAGAAACLALPRARLLPDQPDRRPRGAAFAPPLGSGASRAAGVAAAGPGRPGPEPVAGARTRAEPAWGLPLPGPAPAAAPHRPARRRADHRQHGPGSHDGATPGWRGARGPVVLRANLAAGRCRLQTSHLTSLEPDMSEVGVFHAKTHLSDLLERVEAGEEFVITRRG